MRYFKKLRINVPFQLSNGTLFRFPVVDHDVGAIGTENPILINEFTQAIHRNVGGVVEIQKAEFDELELKKNNQTSLRPRWREELSNKFEHLNPLQINQSTTENAPVAEAVAESSEPPPRPVARRA